LTQIRKAINMALLRLRGQLRAGKNRTGLSVTAIIE
jgi:hypothetical protein